MNRRNNFDFIRAVLATSVIFSHSFDLLGRANPIKEATGGQTDLGSAAVDLFFVASGFLIAQSWMNSRGLGDYLRKRARRIFPGFIAAGLMALLLFGPLPKQFGQVYWREVDVSVFVLRLATLQTLWVPPSFTDNHWPYVNAAIWTIQYEFICYLAVAALGMTGLLRRRLAMASAFAAIFLLYVVHHHFAGEWLARFPQSAFFSYSEWVVGGSPAWYPRFFTYFLAGTLVYLLRDAIPWSAKGAAIATAMLLVSLVVLPGYEIVMPIAGTYLLFWFAFHPRIPLHRFGARGDFSYGLYVYGWPVQQSIIWLTGARIPPVVLFVSSLACALLLAIASWHLIERPFLRFNRSSAAHAGLPRAGEALA